VQCKGHCTLRLAKARFDSEAAALAATEQVSAEAMVKLLSPGNLAVLEAIRRHRPGSVRELTALTGRKQASLSRTLKRFAALRFVGFSDGPGRTRGPSLVARRVRLEIDLTGAGSAVAVEGCFAGGGRQPPVLCSLSHCQAQPLRTGFM
jgi:predicted transcriptional regulator